MGADHEVSSLWYLDSGCRNHMTGNLDIFVELDSGFTSQVKLGDGKLQNAEGKGTIAVYTRGGNRKLIDDVLYVPSLTHNLLSVGQLIQKDYSVHFDVGKCSCNLGNVRLVAAGMIFSKQNKCCWALCQLIFWFLKHLY